MGHFLFRTTVPWASSPALPQRLRAGAVPSAPGRGRHLPDKARSPQAFCGVSAGRPGSPEQSPPRVPIPGTACDLALRGAPRPLRRVLRTGGGGLLTHLPASLGISRRETMATGGRSRRHMLLPQSLLMSLLASYKKEAFGQGAAHHHGRPLRVGTRRAGAVGGVADARAAPAGSARPPGVTDARASPRGSGSLHLGPAPPHARRLGLPGLSGHPIGSLGSGGGASNHLQGHFQL